MASNTVSSLSSALAHHSKHTHTPDIAPASANRHVVEKKISNRCCLHSWSIYCFLTTEVAAFRRIGFPLQSAWLLGVCTISLPRSTQQDGCGANGPSRVPATRRSPRSHDAGQHLLEDSTLCAWRCRQSRFMHACGICGTTQLVSCPHAMSPVTGAKSPGAPLTLAIDQSSHPALLQAQYSNTHTPQ